MSTQTIRTARRKPKILNLCLPLATAIFLLICVLLGLRGMNPTTTYARSTNGMTIDGQKLLIRAYGPIVTHTIEVRVKAGNNEAGRLTNLEVAADRLNMILEMQGADYRVEVQGEITNEPWPDYKQRFISDTVAGQAPDIILSGHEDVAPWGNAGYILSVTGKISIEWTSTYSDFFPTLWDAVTWNGDWWGVPQDTEARPLFFRKDVLQALGWTDAQITQMVTDTLNGDFTLDDMANLSQQATQAGVVDWGLVHRPVGGHDFYILQLDYGGTLYNSNTSHMVLSECPTYRALSFFHNMANLWNVTPMTMTTGFSWDDFHQTIVNGDTLFAFGGTWHWAEWRDNYLGGNEQYLFDNMGFMPYPAANLGESPVTLSHPLVYMISSQAEQPDVAFQLITLAMAPDLVAQYSVDSAHLAVRQAVTQEPVYQNDTYIQSVTYLLNYTTFGPNHVLEADYRNTLFDAISLAETGSMTPIQAMAWLESELVNLLGDEMEIDTLSCFTSPIPPDEDSTLVYSDTQGLTTTIQIPASAVSETTILAFTPIEQPAVVPTGLGFASHAFNLDAFQANLPIPDLTFSLPVTVTIHYSDNDVGMVDESTLLIYFWNGKDWVDATNTCPVPSNSMRNSDDNWVRVPICQIGEFALFGEEEHRVHLPITLKSALNGP